MSDSEDDYNSGEDGDYVPSGEDESEDDYDEKDGKNATFLPCWIDGSAQDDEESSEKRKKRKKTNRDSPSKRKREGGIKLDDVEEHGEEEVKKELTTVDNLTDELASIKEKKLEEKKKERADDLWNSFLKDVGQPVKSNVVKTTASASNATASNDDVPKKTEPATDVKEKKNTVTVTQIFDFAGEKVEVKKEVDANSKEAKKSLKEITSEKTFDKPTTSSSLGIKRPQGGLGSILNKISKKPKIGTLVKSRLDWNSFKQKEGIDDKLKLHNKGKNGFLEKRDFLDRANQRQYEIEKSFRLGLNKSTR
ncbi:craniofacial development protein 1-like isoform X2 [Anneissia japonica]|uniref:craniofacial development protein 1-like isoform X1 n=1 Tax=Anneissia japonica TaxID=1529436 RepID=UPI00142574E2|nr:craniofacial development protein 1-like isoform X1 [Anneissia japonica]XP_033123727.1 craniofacial development protein 1-like isoform X2 [Anneissia japonica]